jgi:hypothetical protein
MSDILVTKQVVKQVSDSNDITEELAKFVLDYIAYYYQEPTRGVLTAQTVEEHVKTIQSQLGMEVTGQIDLNTVKTLEHTPRCGIPDYTKSGAQAVTSWGQRKLTYFIERFVRGLSTSDQADIIKLAFDQWTEVANIQFERVSDSKNANLVLSTGSGRADNFDGPGNTLAWAYLPPSLNYRGQLLMRFDLDETWINDPNSRGILMRNVACHEFGHMLGLEHSRNSRALMAPYYSPGVAKPQAQDDIPRIQALYGPPVYVPPPNPTPTPTPTPSGKYVVQITTDSLSSITVNGKKLTDFSLI